MTPLLDACSATIRDDQRWASEIVATFREAYRCFDEVGLYGPEFDGRGGARGVQVPGPIAAQIIDACLGC